MRLLRLDSATPLDELPEELIVCHDVRNPAQRSEILARKGTAFKRDSVAEVLARGLRELHVVLPDDGDLSEDQAAARLSSVLVGPGTTVGEAHFGQTSLSSALRGIVRVNAAVLDEVNAHAGVLVLTAEADRAVEPGTTIGVVKCAPLFLEAATVEAIRDVVSAHGPVIEVGVFQPTRVALIAPAERLRGGAFDRSRSALATAVEWYGSRLDVVIAADATSEALEQAYTEALDAGVGLILAAGAAATDPLDIVFEGLRQVGGRVDQIGIPLEPGTACWIGSVRDVPVLGLASCELFGRPGALDLLLPRLLSGTALNRDLVRSLALGGLLLGPSRVAPYHSIATTEE